MKTYIEVQFFRFMKWLIYRGYGYCEERDGFTFMQEGRCAGCDASDVQDFIDYHISLIKN